MAITISFVNHKGGVAKTTSTSMVGATLASVGRRVLMIDLDAQANLTKVHSMEDFEEPEAKTIFTALRDKDILPIYDIREREDEVFDLVPSSSMMKNIETVMATVTVGKEMLLKKLLKSVQDDYDFILIDCPPSLGLMSVMALTASNFAMIPASPEVFTLYGLEDILGTIKDVKEYYNPNLDILGFFITKYNPNLNISVAMFNAVLKLTQEHNCYLFQTKIHSDIKVVSSPLLHKSMVATTCWSASRAVHDYWYLAWEILDRLNTSQEDMCVFYCADFRDIWPVFKKEKIQARAKTLINYMHIVSPLWGPTYDPYH